MMRQCQCPACGQIVSRLPLKLRDKELIRLMSEGHTVEQAARFLRTSSSTLNKRLKALRDKHHAKTTPELCVMLKEQIYEQDLLIS